jgi:hypothetical protein
MRITNKGRINFMDKRRRTARALKGLCSDCPSPARLNKTTCEKCHEKRIIATRERRAKKRMDSGGEELDDDKGKYTMTEQERAYYKYMLNVLFSKAPDTIEILKAGHR